MDLDLDGSSLPGPSSDLLAKMFEPPHKIMYKGTVEAARKTCQQTKKWLMISIHDPSDFQCQVLNRDLWKDKSVVAMMVENFIFLQVFLKLKYLVGAYKFSRKRASTILSIQYLSIHCNSRSTNW
jgi:thioredoxin-related protein